MHMPLSGTGLGWALEGATQLGSWAGCPAGLTASMQLDSRHMGTGHSSDSRQQGLPRGGSGVTEKVLGAKTRWCGRAPTWLLILATWGLAKAGPRTRGAGGSWD